MLKLTKEGREAFKKEKEEGEREEEQKIEDDDHNRK